MTRRLVLMFLMAAAVVVSAMGLNFLLNPYGAWRIELINPIFRRVERERVVTPYLLRTAAPETILLGSSRVLMGMRIDQGVRDGVMNAALTAATIVQLSRIAAVALENPRLKRVVWGVDFFAFNTAWNKNDPNFDARIAGDRALKIEDNLLSASALGDGYDFWRRARRGERKLRPTVTAPMPWPMPLVCEQFAATADHGLQLSGPAEIEDELANDLPDYATYQFSPAFMRMFSDAVAAARKRGVEVIVFVPPMSQYELEMIRQGGQWRVFQNFKRELAAIGPFWDFSGYNAMARTDECFMHVMHFKVAAGEMMLRIVLGLDADACDADTRAVANSAMRVDSETIASALALQNRRLEDATRTETRYSRLARQAIARRARENQAETVGRAAPDAHTDQPVVVR